MTLKEDVREIEKEINETSFAMEMINFLKDQTDKVNRRLVAIIFVILFLWGLTIGGFVYYITNYTVTDEVETSQEVDDIDTIENSYIINGGDYNGEDKTNSKTH